MTHPSTRPAAPLFLGLAIVSVLGCDGAPPSVVSLPPDAIVVADSAVKIVGTSESIASVQDLEPLPDGAVWALNSVEPFIVGFDAVGGTIAEYGSAGGGPEEFLFPTALVTRGIDDHAWVFDLRRHSVVRVSAPEAERMEARLPREGIPPGSIVGGMSMISPTVRTARMGSEIILPRTDGSLQSGLVAFRLAILQAELMAWNPETQALRSVVALGDVLDPPDTGFELTEGGFPMWYRLWAVCGDDQIRVYDRVRNVVRGFSSDGTETEALALPEVQLTAVSPRQFATAVFDLRAAEVTGGVGRTLTPDDSLRVINDGVNSVQGSPEQLAAYLPRYVDLRCEDDGTVWLQPIDLERGNLKGGPTWLRVTPGSTRAVRLPNRFDAMRFTTTRIWGVQRDDFDVASIAWIDSERLF